MSLICCQVPVLSYRKEDAAKKGGEAAVGVVARNSKGVPILLQTDPVSPRSPWEAELLAVLHVVWLAIAKGWQGVLGEGDRKEI
ncbi:hypothetical protein TIFTF001_012120 [Ficus carica]|uniref:RNase H type-1 domain-containing protein n=1 Tax=Ficus carica TaxID=3494 RepID=A0AA88A1S7_FICCA|nr:hypothetical protein TIFTF001_012120 [Ficus carica]